MMTKKRTSFFLIAVLMLLLLFGISACSRAGQVGDPGAWGYDCKVTYDSLGGIINQREVRTTFYMTNSYAYEPAGSSGFLIQPVKEGHTLVGWYTAKEDILNDNGAVIGYRFNAEDRWDFDEDRVQGDLTLYAYWIPRAIIRYMEGGLPAGESRELFVKNITAESGIQPLSYSVEAMCTPKGHTLLDYYMDPACTTQYVFAAQTFTSLIPSNRVLYTLLTAEFPAYLEEIPNFIWNETSGTGYVEQEEGADPLEEGDTAANPYFYIEKVGFRLTEQGKTNYAEIRARKNQIIADSIAAYERTNENTTVYLKFIEGDYIRVSRTEDFMRNGKYYFDGIRGAVQTNGYIFASDIDFTDVSFEMTESFSGTVFGNGYALKNLRLVANSRRAMTIDVHMFAGLCQSMENVLFDNLVFDNCMLLVSEASGNSMTAGLLAGQASGVTLRDCTFRDCIVRTGVNAYAEIQLKTNATDADARIVLLGSLFGNASGCRYENVTYTGCTIRAGGTVRITDTFFTVQ